MVKSRLVSNRVAQGLAPSQEPKVSTWAEKANSTLVVMHDTLAILDAFNSRAFGMGETGAEGESAPKAAPTLDQQIEAMRTAAAEIHAQVKRLVDYIG